MVQPARLCRAPAADCPTDNDCWRGSVNFLIKRLERLDRDRYLTRFQPLFDQVRGYPPPEELALTEEVGATLNVLHHQYKLGLVTTRRREQVDEFLTRVELDPSTFDTIIARDDVRNLQPHSEALLLAAQEMGLEPENVLVVCDTDGSLRSGGAANMATSGVLGGLSDVDDFSSADLVLSTPGELTDGSSHDDLAQSSAGGPDPRWRFDHGCAGDEHADRVMIADMGFQQHWPRPWLLSLICSPPCKSRSGIMPILIPCEAAGVLHGSSLAGRWLPFAAILPPMPPTGSTMNFRSAW